MLYEVITILHYEVLEFYKAETAEVFSLTGTISEIPFGCVKSYEVTNSQTFILNLLYN